MSSTSSAAAAAGRVRINAVVATVKQSVVSTALMLKDITFEPTQFTPADVARITGLTTAMQRDWRQRGFLAKSDKHARFEAPEVARIMVMQALAQRTIGPRESYTVASQFSAVVVECALIWMDGGWGGADPGATFDNLAPEDRGQTKWEIDHAANAALAEKARKSPEAKRRESFEDLLHDVTPYDDKQRAEIRTKTKQYRSRHLRSYQHQPQEKRLWLLERFARGRNASWSADATGDLIWWPTGQVDFGGWQNCLEGMRDDDPRLDGASIILPVDGLARRLVRLAEKPLLTIVVAGAK